MPTGGVMSRRATPISPEKPSERSRRGEVILKKITLAAKERKDVSEETGVARLLVLSAGITESVFLDLKFIGAEIDQQSMLDAGGFEVTEQLGNMFVCKGATSFKFDDQTVLDQQVGVVFAKYS